MGKYNVFKNGSVDIIAADDYQDNGWTISGSSAIHDSLNSGYLENSIFIPDSETAYVLTLNLVEISGGSFKVYVGDTLLDEFTQPGIKSIDIPVGSVGKLMFWSDANMYFNSEVIVKGEIESKTILFDNDNNAFTGYASYTADFMTKFLDDFYRFEDGSLYRLNVNDSRNTFGGITYPSKITFFVNTAPTEDKDFYSIIFNSTDPWYVEDVYIYPTKGKHKGQRSRIKKGNFKRYKGKFVADFLRDLNDPRFQDELSALMNGATLSGEIMRITISNQQTTETRLVSIETEFSIK